MSSTIQPSVTIVSPALAEANNGNWHTAARWAQMLRRQCSTTVAAAWDGTPCDLLVALHARRSAASIDAFARAHPTRPLIVVLTGTDLYRDIETDPQAQRSLQQASTLVVMQDQGPARLSSAMRGKAVIIYPSARRLRPAPPPRDVLRVVCVGHLREEKSPATFMRAARHLRERADIHFSHIGAALDDTLAQAARRAQAECSHYRWLGDLPRAATRQHIRRAHLLVSTSLMEGGAQVIAEAVQSGTAVLASRIDGHVGALGSAHPGFFKVGDDAALAELIARARDEPGWLAELRLRTVERADHFEPREEQQRLRTLIHACLGETP